MSYNNSILVTGSHRSGSTWVGKMIAASGKIGYLQEPFNPNIKMGVSKYKYPYPFYYTVCTTGNEFQAQKKSFENILKYKFPCTSHLRNASNMREIAQVFKGQANTWLYKVKRVRPLVKDPIALFSAEWLHSTFGMKVIILIRHPAAFCSSLKIKNWQFDFNNFLAQKELMKVFLSSYETRIQELADSKHDIIDQGILLWLCIHEVIRQYQEKWKDWKFLRHEDLSINPLDSFKEIYYWLDLEFKKQVEEKILQSTGTHNPVEQNQNNQFIRDSKKNITNWKTRLTEEEISRIYSATKKLSSLFYSESEW